MKIQEPIPHWNNFSVPELKEILKHCEALERLGIAQDGKMIISIERDITLREKQYVHSNSKLTKITQQTTRPNLGKINKTSRKTIQQEKQKPQDYLLEQTI